MVYVIQCGLFFFVMTWQIFDPQPTQLDKILQTLDQFACRSLWSIMTMILGDQVNFDRQLSIFHLNKPPHSLSLSVSLIKHQGIKKIMGTYGLSMVKNPVIQSDPEKKSISSSGIERKIILKLLSKMTSNFIFFYLRFYNISCITMKLRGWDEKNKNLANCP